MNVFPNERFINFIFVFEGRLRADRKRTPHVTIQVLKRIMNDQITITSEVDKRNPAICRFTVNRTLHIGTASFDNKTQAEQSLLAQALFEIEGITRVQLIGHLLVLSKIPEQEWEQLIKPVEAILQAFLV